MRLFQLVGFLLILLLTHQVRAEENGLQTIPEFNSHLIDQTGWISSQEGLVLRKKLDGIKTTGAAQIAVLIVDSTKPEAIEQYSMRVVEKWKLGKEGVDNGILLLIAKTDRKIRIEVGYGLEGAIPDAIAKRIITEDMTLPLKSNKPYDALNIAIDKIVGYAKGEIKADEKTEAAGLDLPGGAIASIIGLTIISFICFLFDDSWAIGAGIVLPFIGGGVSLLFYTFGIALAIAIISLVCAALIRLCGEASGVSGGGSSGSGGSIFSGGGGGIFGGGGASGDFWN